LPAGDLCGLKRRTRATAIWFVHRQLIDGVVYFLNNRRDRAEFIDARFRVSGKAPELWHADSGVIEPAPYREDDDRTVVPLNLDPHDAVFVVFRKSATQGQHKIPATVREPLYTLMGPWDVHFQQRRGAPQRAVLTELESWSPNTDAGIRYFSGTASYEKTFQVPRSWLTRGQSLEIDPGE